MPSWLWGYHSVREALGGKERRSLELWAQHGRKGPEVGELVRLARAAGARVRWVSRGELDRISAGGTHQGLALRVSDRASRDFKAFIDELDPAQRQNLVLVALDQIQDPRNLGAIARSASCLGARALLVCGRRSAPVTQAAVQASAGAIEKIPVYDVGNLSQALDALKSRGFWIYGADGSGRPAWETRFNTPLVLVIGSEGSGLRRLVGEQCDEWVAVPQAEGGVASLNASCAASVLLYEASRQLVSRAAAARLEPHKAQNK